MASTDARPLPQKNVAYRVIFPILDADGDLITGATGLDSEVSKDCGTFADCTNEATEIATSSGMYYLDLTSTEMNADSVAVIVKTTSSGGKTTPIVLYPEEAGDIRVNVTAYGGTAGTFSSGRPEVNTTHFAGTAATASSGIPEVKVNNIAASAITATSIASDAITDAKVASDVTIASVTGAVGSVTGAVGSVTGNVGGNVTGSVGSVATGGITAASIAADAIGASELAADAVTEIQSGLATAANLATLAGYVDTEVAAIKAVTDQFVFGTANRVNAQVYGIETGAVTAGAIATDAIGAAELAADAVTEIQSGLATASALSTAQTDITTIKGYTDDIGVAGAGLTAVPWNAAWDAEVQSEVQDAIEVNNLDHLVKAAVDTNFATTVHLDSVIGQLADNGTTATFDRTTDSLEALQAEHDVTQGKIDAVDDYVDTEIGAIKTVVDAVQAKTDNLPSDPADASVVAGLIAAVEAKVDIVDTVVDSILVDTAEIGAAGAGLTVLATQASVNTIDDFVDTEVAAILAAVDTEVAAIKAKTDQLTFTVANQVDSNALSGGGGLDAAGVRAAVGLASANLDTQLTAIDDFVDTEVAAVLAAVDTEVAAIKAKTDLIPASPAAVSDIPTAAAVSDAVWDEVLSGHLTGGSTGNALNAAGSAGDPWSTALPGAYSAGTAGKIIGDNVNATISSRASQTSVDTVDDLLDTEVAAIKTVVDSILIDTAEIGTAGAGLTALATQASVNTIDDFLDTEIAAIKAKTDNLPASPANEATLTTIAGYVDTEVAAIKAKTDQLTFTTANQVDATAITVSDKTGYSLSSAAIQAIWDAATSALTTVGSIGKWIVDKLDVVVSTRASQTTLDTLDDYVDSEVAAIKAKTDNLPASPANEATLTTIAGYIDTEVAAIKAKTDLIPASPATAGSIATLQTSVDDLPTNAELATALGTADDAVLAAIAALNNLSQANIRTAVGLASANLDTQLADLPTNAELATALDAIPTATENADALLKRDMSAVTGEASRSPLNALRFIRNKFSTSATPGVVTVYKEDDTTTAFTKTVTTDAAADPIVEG